MDDLNEKGNGEDSRDATVPRKKRKYKTPGKWPPDEQMREVIIKKAGITSQVADAVGMSVRAVNARKKRSPKFSGWFDEARERLLDMAEATIFTGISARNYTATIFFLKCQAKHRGWIERQEVTGADGKALFDLESEARKIADGIGKALEDIDMRRRIVEIQTMIGARTALTDERTIQ